MQRYSRTMARHHSQMVCHEASPGGPWDFVTIVHYYYNIQLKHKKGEKELQPGHRFICQKYSIKSVFV